MVQTISFLGPGLMVVRQARRLLHHGYPVTAWNRRARAEALLPFGTLLADAAVETVAGAGVVISMLEKGRIVGEVPCVQ